MSKKIFVIVGLMALLIVGYFSLEFFVKNKIEKALAHQEDTHDFSYQHLHFNLIKGSLSMDSIHFNTPTLAFHSAQGRLKGFNYFKYLFKNEIALQEVEVDRPILQISKGGKTAEDAREKDTLEMAFFIKKVRIKNGQLQLLREGKPELKLDSFQGTLEEFVLDKETLTGDLPFLYSDYNIEGKQFSYLLNTLQTLTVDHFHMKTQQADFKKVRLLPNFSREQYTKVIPYEKDLMDIDLDSLQLINYHFSLQKSGALKASKLRLKKVDAQIYRDKLVNDDPHDKKLYSQMLRELDFKLQLDTLQIEDAAITYEEVQENTKKTGKVFFTHLNALGTAIGNTALASSSFPETQVHITSQFMGEAPLAVDWSFKINDPQDHFRITGKGQGISAEAINNFFIPGMNMEAEGDPIRTLYFDFYGDQNTASGDFQMIYDNLKINVLKKNGREKNNIFTAIANLFVSHKKTANDKPVKVEDVERDKKRSFWNYLWTSVFTGLKQTML